nr:phospholipid-transporting ATPase ABCA3-like isoform X4 [Peromyscus maniculatus bairdii]
MASLESQKLLILLWKNFTLKRRKFGALVFEIILMFVFSIILLVARKLLAVKKMESFHFPVQRVSNVPSFIQVFTTSSHPWELAYVPSNSIMVQNIIENVKRDLNFHMKVTGFSSESDFEDYMSSTVSSKTVLAAIVFDHSLTNSDDPLPKKVKYYLRFSNIKKNMNASAYFQEHTWFTSFLFPPGHLEGPRNLFDEDGGSPGYISEGFLAVQHALDKAIMRHHGGAAATALLKDTSLFIQRFPTPAFHHDFFHKLANILIPLTMACTFLVNYLTLVQSIVWEKENRLKEYQLMIGLSNWMLWVAYFITFFCLYFINIIFICVILFFKTEPARIFQYNDPILVFVFLSLYASSSIFFSFMVSTLFNRVNFAMSLGSSFFLLTYFPYVIMYSKYEQMTFKQKLIWCFDYNVGMAFGFKFLIDAETKKTGVKWSNIFSSADKDSFSFAYVLGMLLVDAFLYALVAWYIEAVFPGEYGVPKPWNFFMTHSYWFGDTPQTNPEITQFHETIQSKYFEAEPADLMPGIQIKHLHKVFQENNTTKIAIEDLSLNIYEGQITVLLGHNGAGKSTTLSILSGLYPPTRGEAYVYGYDISQNMAQIRKSLGLCPQQNLLFDHLTVSEHLYFYCRVKGVPQKVYLKETNNMLSAFNLVEKHDAFSKSLSGGMKRKLAIIIALIGGSKVVILDEPTSGMDPASRRATWDLLQAYKQDRIILLTTHYMDEADMLGDRIAIMVQGTLRCCGSSVFLKRQYGIGYHVVMVKEPHCDTDEISKLIHDYASTATLKTNVGNELSFILPLEYTQRFEALFTALEENQERLGISSFGVSITTMEEVFLRVSHMQDIQATQSPPVGGKENKNKGVPSSTRGGFPTQNEDPPTVFNTGCSLYCQQFHAMFIKRMVYNWRNWKTLLVQILGLVISALFLLKSHDLSYKDEKTRRMNLDEYGQTIVPFSISGKSNLTTSLLTHLENMLKPGNHKLKEVQGDLLKYLEGNEDCIHSCIIALSMEVVANRTEITVLFNNQAYHSPSLSLAILDNILFMSISGADASITVSNKPQPDPQAKRTLGSVEGKVVALKIQLGMALLVSGFCLLTVTERTTKAKHMQFLSGVSVLVYWLSALMFDFIIFFISCCLLLDIISKELSGESEDKDVENERKKILHQPEEFLNSPVLIKELTKIYFKYPFILAVKNISLAVQERECFGLLGFNGAGKTTTFQILTGEKTPTTGDVFIDGISITKNILKVRSKIGYCPQFDALLEYMTGREIMIMYARIWGVSEHQIQPYVNKYLNSLDLEPHSNYLISTYSGGNKRRLSTAIATMGKPSVILLDEPSTGMDPKARRLLWDTVIKTQESGKAIIITSHSMEECEALCTRLSIMVKGKLTCLGSPQYLKNKFGDVYILKAKVKSEETVKDFKSFIRLTFPGSDLKQENQGILNYYIPSKDNSWGKMFGILEKAKEEFNLEDYSISQITLDQVFLAFANQDNTGNDYETEVP